MYLHIICNTNVSLKERAREKERESQRETEREPERARESQREPEIEPERELWPSLWLTLWFSLAPIPDGEMVELLAVCVYVRRLLVETQYLRHI